MSKIKVSPNNIGAEISKIVQNYTQDVRDEFFADIDTVADGLVDELQASSPDDGVARRNKYRKQWKKRTDYESNLEKRVTVHNDKAYQLTHLLEDGHAKVNGGRVAARVHIQPAADKASANLENKALEAAKPK